MRPAAPGRTTACGKGATTAGSAWSSKAIRNTARPAASAARATSPGSGPPPARMPSGPSGAGTPVMAAFLTVPRGVHTVVLPAGKAARAGEPWHDRW